MKQRPFPSPTVVLSDRLQAVLRPPPTPFRLAARFPGCGYPAATLRRPIRSAAGPGRASPVPAIAFRTFHALYAGESIEAALQVLRLFHGLRRDGTGSALPLSHPRAGTLTALQASPDAADRSVAPPTGLVTLGFDPARFQTEPPACYRASWQLPGPDSHRQATTSLCQIVIYIINLRLWAHSDFLCKRLV